LVRALSEAQPRPGAIDPAGSTIKLKAEVSADHLPPALDQEALAQFRATVGEDTPELLRELIGIYLEDTPKRLAQLQAGLAQADVKEVERLAHSLKATGATFGALRLADLCQQLELMARTGKLAGAKQLLSQVHAEYQRVCQVLADWS